MARKKQKQKITHTVGIDEAGRGPLAGPVAVGAVVFAHKHRSLFNKTFRGVKDSKQLSAEGREEWFKILKQAQKDGWVRFSVSLVGAPNIDSKGIVPAIRLALRRSLARLDCSQKNTHVLLDGGLRAPASYTTQSTIIKGDEKEAVIALASIVAKVTRDRIMHRAEKKYPEYGFPAHKGYGTKKHYEMISKHGMCPLHRRTFLKNIRA